MLERVGFLGVLRATKSSLSTKTRHWIMHPPVDVQEAVALLAAIDVATLASTIAGGLSSWHLGQRTENYAGGAKYAWAIEQWRKRVEEIANRYYSWVQKVDV
jgi:hypothetical protein